MRHLVISLPPASRNPFSSLISPDNQKTATNEKSFPEILGRVAYPVEPFGFMFVPLDPLPPMLDGITDRLGKQPDLFDQLDDGQANELQDVHKVVCLCSYSL
jgi:hypothetical protein